MEYSKFTPLLHILGWLLIIFSLFFSLSGCDNQFYIGGAGATTLTIIAIFIAMLLMLLVAITGVSFVFSFKREKRP